MNPAYDRRFELRRDRALDQLGWSYAAGALSTGTFEARAEIALRSEAVEELHAVFWDLPEATAWLSRMRARTRLASGVAFRLPHADLTLVAGGGRKSWVVGRSRSSDVHLIDETVSARHARITVRQGAWSIQDLGSTNGTVLNGRPIDHAVLRAGDELLLGYQEAHVLGKRRRG